MNRPSPAPGLRRRPPMASRRLARGFTLVELMVGLGLIAILLGVAAPMFTQAMDHVSAKSVAVELAGDLRFARGEALKRNTTITVAPKTGGWSAGWEVRTAAGDLISQHVASRAGVSVAAPTAGVTFAGNGRIADTETATSDLKWTVDTASASGTRCVRLGVTGAANIQLGACA